MEHDSLFMLSLAILVMLVTWWLAALLFPSRTGQIRKRLRNDGPRDSEQPAGAAGGVGALLTNIGQAAAKPFMPKDREKQSALKRKLGQAGIYSATALRLMIGCKVILLATGLVGGYFAGMALDNVLLGCSLGGLVAYLGPSLWLKRRISKHQEGLEHGLPDALDLLVVCVESGLTIDSSMQRVGQELALAHPGLAREMEIAHMETRVGLSRAEALKNLGQRTGLASLQSLAAMLIQAERFGTSIASALRIHAESLRTNRQHIAEEMAAKASVKLSFPVVLFIFPAVLIVLAGSAALGLFKSALFAD